mgnify:CR=1 FL=1
MHGSAVLSVESSHLRCRHAGSEENIYEVRPQASGARWRFGHGVSICSQLDALSLSLSTRQDSRLSPASYLKRTTLFCDWQ